MIMQDKSVSELEVILQDRKSKRYKLSKELSELDTEIIGIKLALDNAKEKERIFTDQQRSRERSSY